MHILINVQLNVYIHLVHSVYTFSTYTFIYICMKIFVFTYMNIFGAHLAHLGIHNMVDNKFIPIQN